MLRDLDHTQLDAQKRQNSSEGVQTRHLHKIQQTQEENDHNFSGIRTHDSNNKRSQNYSLDRPATGVGQISINRPELLVVCGRVICLHVRFHNGKCNIIS